MQSRSAALPLMDVRKFSYLDDRFDQSNQSPNRCDTDSTSTDETNFRFPECPCELSSSATIWSKHVSEVRYEASPRDEYTNEDSDTRSDTDKVTSTNNAVEKPNGI